MGDPTAGHPTPPDPPLKAPGPSMRWGKGVSLGPTKKI
jgi:hypothetical protein